MAPIKKPIPDLQEVMKSEFIKCASDPQYFIMKYVYIQTSNGRMLFSLYEFQKKTLHLLSTKDRLLVLKSRQLGITTLCSAYALWCMMFKKDYSVLALAPDQDKSREIITKITFGYDQLPAWLVKMCGAGHTEKNKLSLRLDNGSKAIAASGASKSARGKTANLLILDEAAFIDNAQELWGSAQQTLATGGHAIVLSTPNGAAGWFYEMWESAENRDNEFVPIRLPWQVHPDRNQAWRDRQNEELGKKMASQECDTSFITSGDGYFDAEDIEYYRQQIESPKSMSGPNNDFWIWEVPDFNKSYMLIADTSRGDGNDTSAFQIIDIFTGDQVAEYKGDIDIKLYPNFIVSKAIEYNNALVIAENVGISISTINAIIEIGYKNLYYSPKGDTTDVHKFMYTDPSMEPDKFTPGFTTSTKTRPQVFLVFKGYFQDRSINLKSTRLISEISKFIWKNGKEQAQSGCNDDALICYAIGMYLRNTAMSSVNKGIEMSRALLSSVKSSKSAPIQTKYLPNKYQNPYEMNIGGYTEDISWVID